MPSRPTRRTQRDVVVLGISAHYHDAAAAIVRNGEIVAAASEERFTRQKGDARLPESAVDYVLDAAKVSPNELAACVYYESPFAKFERLLSTQLLGDPRGLPMFHRSLSVWVPQKFWVARQIRHMLGAKVDVVYSDHHLSHAASAYLPSPFTEAAILTVDGVGEWTTTAIARGSDTEIEFVEQVEYPNSLGLLYSAFTAYCGFRVNSGEYKLMGLAPFGEPVHAATIEQEIVAIADDGSFALNPTYFPYLHTTRAYNTRFEQLFGGPARQESEPLQRRHADIAASIQVVLDKAMLALARRAVERTGSRNLCLAGGVALNVVSVGAIERSGVADEVWVQPAAGDAGGALGAALWASTELYEQPRSVERDDSMCGAFLGPTPGTPSAVRATLEDYGLVFDELPVTELAERTSRLLADGKVVAVARGRMEFGPRALGNRSILADARDPDMQLRLNLKTKFREGFRPFAPVVLEERAAEYFDTAGTPSPYMLKTYPVSEHLRMHAPSEATDLYKRVRQARSTIPAVTHVDHSARVQTVDRRRHPFLHDVLTGFAELTGCPVLVNTSFNVRGEPIVNDVVDAVECFLRTDVDALVVDDLLVERDRQPSDALKPRRKQEFTGD